MEKLMNIHRYPYNPILTPAQVPPCLPGCEVVGAFNAAAARYGGETLLLLRVAEKPAGGPAVRCLVLDPTSGRIRTVTVPRDEEKYDFSDSRMILRRGTPNPTIAYLTSLSYLRLARSRDGIHFTVDDRPFLFPQNEYETFGMEDPRITQIGSRYYIYFSAVSPHGICEEMAVTTDFRQVRRLGIFFLPENKDVVIFPQKIGGNYYALSRPVPNAIGAPEIWISESADLRHWGGHEKLLGLRPGGWDSARIGAGAVPIPTERGWLEIYHGATAENRYCLGALLLSQDDPHRVLARSKTPVLEPTETYERKGFFGDVVFTCGALAEGDILHLYYGVSDNSMAYAGLSIRELLASLGS